MDRLLLLAAFLMKQVVTPARAHCHRVWGQRAQVSSNVRAHLRLSTPGQEGEGHGGRDLCPVPLLNTAPTGVSDACADAEDKVWLLIF